MSLELVLILFPSSNDFTRDNVPEVERAGASANVMSNELITPPITTGRPTGNDAPESCKV